VFPSGQDEAIHTGQIAMLRRALGKQPIRWHVACQTSLVADPRRGRSLGVVEAKHVGYIGGSRWSSPEQHPFFRGFGMPQRAFSARSLALTHIRTTEPLPTTEMRDLD